MFERVTNATQLKHFLQKRVDGLAKILGELDKAREEDALRKFMSWNGSTMHVAVVHADEAARFITFLDGEAERDGEVLSDESKFEIVKEEVQRNLINMSTRLVSRSTSASANLDEDAQRMFWIDMYQALNGGY